MLISTGSRSTSWYGERPRAVADRIGPDPCSLLTGSDGVPTEHVEHYHRRGGFLRPTERVDQDAVLRLADEDLQAAR